MSERWREAKTAKRAAERACLLDAKAFVDYALGVNAELSVKHPEQQWHLDSLFARLQAAVAKVGELHRVMIRVMMDEWPRFREDDPTLAYERVQREDDLEGTGEFVFFLPDGPLIVSEKKIVEAYMALREIAGRNLIREGDAIRIARGALHQ